MVSLQSFAIVRRIWRVSGVMVQHQARNVHVWSSLSSNGIVNAPLHACTNVSPTTGRSRPLSNQPPPGRLHALAAQPTRHLLLPQPATPQLPNGLRQDAQDSSPTLAAWLAGSRHTVAGVWCMLQARGMGRGPRGAWCLLLLRCWGWAAGSRRCALLGSMALRTL